MLVGAKTQVQKGIDRSGGSQIKKFGFQNAAEGADALGAGGAVVRPARGGGGIGVSPGGGFAGGDAIAGGGTWGEGAGCRVRAGRAGANAGGAGSAGDGAGCVGGADQDGEGEGWGF